MTSLPPARPSPAAVVAEYERIVRCNYSPDPDFRFPGVDRHGLHWDTIKDVWEDFDGEVRFEVNDLAREMGFFSHLPPEDHKDYELLRMKADAELDPWIKALRERFGQEVADRPPPLVHEVEDTPHAWHTFDTETDRCRRAHVLTLGFLRRVTKDLPDDTQVTIPTPMDAEGDWLNVSHVWLPGDETGFSVQLVTEDSFDSRQQ